MKLSLQTLALFICLAGLGAALFVSQSKNAALREELLGLRQSLGLVDFSAEQDKYSLADTGDETVQDCTDSPTYLLRVENHQNYQIEVKHYGSGKRKIMRFDIGDPIVAISFFPNAPLDNLFIRSTKTHNLNTFHSVKIDAGALIKHSNHGVFGDEIGDNIILSLFFGPEGFQIPFGQEEFNWRHGITVAKSKRLCDACNIETVTFRLVKRSE